MAEAESRLGQELGAGYRVVVSFEHRGEAERVRYNLKRLDAQILDGGAPPHEGELAFVEAQLSEGFVAPELKLAVIPFRRLVHRRRGAAPSPARGRMATFTDLRVGDHVVHEDHGIARFAGFETKTVGGVTRDYLELTYRGDDRVFAPTDQLAKITRYVGTGGRGAAALRAGLQALGGGQGSCSTRGPGAGRRAAQPLRGAEGAAAATRSRRMASGS